MNQAVSRPATSQPETPGESFVGASAAKPLRKPGKLLQLASLLLLFSVTALVISLTFLLALNESSQQRTIAKDNYQAVFLNNGQVYFGKIARIGAHSLDLRGIYYLQTNGSGSNTQTTSQSNISLVKLGCELHAPYDQMIINADQVVFWENIQDSSQVVSAINTYKKQNNGKLNCDTASQNSTQQAPSSSSTGTSGSAATSSSSTGTSTTTKKP